MVLTLPIVLLLLVVGLYSLWFYKKNWKILQFSRTLRGPPFLPVVGNVYVLLGKKVNDVLTAVKYFVLTYGPTPISFWIGHDFYYITTDAQELKLLLNDPKCMNKGAAYEDFKIFFPNSLILVPFEIWKPRRKLNSRCFKSGMLKSYMPVFYESSLKLVEYLEQATKKFDLVHVLDKFIFKTYFETAFGVRKEFPETEGLGDACVTIQSYFGKRIVDPILPVKLWLKITREGRKVQRMVDEARGVLNMILKYKRENDFCEDVDESNLTQLDMLMRDKTFDEEDIFQEMALFTAAATDTTGHTLALTVALIGMFPETQQKIYDEVMSVVSHDGPIGVEDLPKLKYTEMVILEGLRMFPSIPIIARTIGEDVDLGNKRVLPKDSSLLISIWHLHRDPKYWKDPELFDPERFNPENISKIEPYSFLPFSGGPRDCIGKTFAMMEMKITIATVVRALEIRCSHKTTKELYDMCISCISLNISKPLECQFYKRHTA